MSTKPTSQLVITPAVTGHVLTDYVGTPATLEHVASCYNTTLSMDLATGYLRMRRADQLVFEGDIMDISLLTALTPALRFVELANLMVG